MSSGGPPTTAADLKSRYAAGERDFPRLRLEDGAQLQGAVLANIVAPNAMLPRAELPEADLTGAKLSQAVFGAVNLSYANLDGADLTAVTIGSLALLADASMVGVNLTAANLTMARLERASLRGADLSRAILEGATIESADLSGAKFDGASLREVHASRANLTDADLRGVNLAAADLRNAVLVGADLRGAVVDTSTQLDNAQVADAKIDRFTLLKLQSYGGLSRASLSTMAIEDDVVELRQHFSGFMQYVHFVALVVFVAPYVWFIGSVAARAEVRAEAAHLVEASADRCKAAGAGSFNNACESMRIALAAYGEDCSRNPSGRCERMLISLLRFIYPGVGILGFLAFLPFCFYLLYNGFRASLMWKTKTLEQREAFTGVPVIFLFDDHPRWRRIDWCVKWGFFLNVAAVLAHTVVHLLTRVPTF